MTRVYQYDRNGRCLCSGRWIHGDFDLHVLTFDVLIKGCVRVEYEVV